MRRITAHNIIRRRWHSLSSSNRSSNIQSCNRCTVKKPLCHQVRCPIQSSSYYHQSRSITSSFSTTAIINHSSSDTTNNDHNDNKNNGKHVAKVRSALSSGPVPYEVGWAYQHVLLHRRLNHMRMMQKKQQNNTATNANSKHSAADHQDAILLFEHEPVYTLGRGASEDHLTFLNNESDGGIEKRRRLNRKYRGDDASRLNIDTTSTAVSDLQQQQNMSVEEEVNHLLQTSLLNNNNSTSQQPVLAPNNIPIYRIERGGEVTYHGPGQLVMYPLLNLKQSNYKQDLHWYLRQIEQVIIETLSHYDIQSNRDSINTGVWVNSNKIAAVGVSSSRWITTHGLAINVSPNLDHFDKEIMIPCGIDGRGVTSMKELLEGTGDTTCPSVEEVGEVALSCFENVFNVELDRDTDPI